MKSTKELAWELGLLRKRSSSTSALTRLQKTNQLFSHLIVIDFESTCWQDIKNRPSEIIEFPAVLLESSTGNILEEFHQYVHPMENPTLSGFCVELTGITQEQVDQGIPIDICLRKFSAWLKRVTSKYNIVFYSSDNPSVNRCTFVTWSDWDLGVCLLYECRRKQIRKPPELNSWIDLRATYRKFYGRKPQGLNGALKDVGIDFEGREHSGVCDARNTAKLAYRMMCDGCVMNITKTLPGGVLPVVQQPKKTSMKRSISVPMTTSEISEHRNTSNSANEQTPCKKPKINLDENVNQGQHLKGSAGMTFCSTIQNDGYKHMDLEELVKDNRETLAPPFLQSNSGDNIEECPGNLKASGEGKGKRSLSQCLKLVLKKYFSPKEKHRDNNIPSNTETKSNFRNRNSKHRDKTVDPVTTKFQIHEDLPSKTNAEISGESVKTCTSGNSPAVVCKLREITNQMASSTRVCNKSKIMEPDVDNKPSLNCQGMVKVIQEDNSSSVSCIPHSSNCMNKFKIPMLGLTGTVKSALKKPSSSVSYPKSSQSGGLPTCRLITPINGPNVSYSKISTMMKRTPPMCECGRRSNRKIVQTPGPNVGRVFFACPLGRKGQGSKSGCGFFKWEEHFYGANFKSAKLAHNHCGESLLKRTQANGSSPTFTSSLKKDICCDKHIGNFTPFSSGFRNGGGSKALSCGQISPLPQPNFSTPNTLHNSSNM